MNTPQTFLKDLKNDSFIKLSTFVNLTEIINSTIDNFQIHTLEYVGENGEKNTEYFHYSQLEAAKSAYFTRVSFGDPSVPTLLGQTLPDILACDDFMKQSTIDGVIDPYDNVKKGWYCVFAFKQDNSNPDSKRLIIISESPSFPFSPDAGPISFMQKAFRSITPKEILQDENLIRAGHVFRSRYELGIYNMDSKLHNSMFIATS